MGKKKAVISRQLADTDLRLLRIFKAVCESGGFTAAEPKLNLSNSSISNYVADLEKRLDMRLCNRGRQGFKLTEHGHVVYKATLGLLTAINSFHNTVNLSHNTIQGSLSIAITEHMTGQYQVTIANLLSHFTKTAPNVDIEIITLDSDGVTSAVVNNRVDVGITVTPNDIHDLYSRPLFEETMALFCAHPHPLFDRKMDSIAATDLETYYFVESPRLMPGRETHPDMIKWNKRAKAHHQEARAALILSGNYLGFLPKHFVQQWGLDKTLKSLQHYQYKNEISAICKRKRLKEIIIETFYSGIE